MPELATRCERNVIGGLSVVRPSFRKFPLLAVIARDSLASNLAASLH